MAAERAGIGVVGAGRWGKNLIRAFESLDRCIVTAICDVDPLKLNHPEFPRGARLCTHFSEVLRDPAVTAVVIATPARAHAPLALRALEAGKHVFVEKPMALSLHDAHRMRDAAVRSGRHLMVGHLLRYHPAIAELERLIQAKKLGEIRRAVALRIGPRAVSSDEGPWWSLAPHDVSLVRRLLGAEGVAVSAHRRDFADGTSTIGARLRLSSGSAWLLASTASQQKTRRLAIFGDRAAAVFDEGGGKPTLTLAEGPQLLRSIETFMELQHSREDPEPDIALSGGTPIPFGDEEPLRSEASHFLSAVLDGGRIATDAVEGCSVMAILEAGRLSMSRGGRWVRVPTSGARPFEVTEQEQPL